MPNSERRNTTYKIFLSVLLYAFSSLAATAQLFRNDSVVGTLGGVVEGTFTQKELEGIDSIQLVFSTNKHYNYKIVQFTLVPSYDEWCIGSSHVEKTSFTNRLTYDQKKLISSIPVNSSFSINSIIADIDGKEVPVSNTITISVAGNQACIFRYPKKIRETYFSVIDTTDKRKRNIGKETLFKNAGITKSQFIKNKFIMIDSGSTDSKSGKIKKDMQIISYNFLACSQSSGYTGVLKVLDAGSDRITHRIKRAVRRVQKGDYIYLFNIKAKQKNGTITDIGFLKLKILD